MSSKKLCLAVSTYVQQKTLFPRRILAYSVFLGQTSVLRQKINYGHYEEGAKEFLKWIYAGGRKIMGLVRRRKLESDLFSSYRILDKSLL